MYVFFIFIVLTCLFTFPLIIRITSSIYGFSQFTGDPFGTLWWMWWYRYAWENGWSISFVPIVGYPFGVDLSSLPIAPLLNLPVAGFNYLIGNEILTYNIFILMGIFLSASCMYYLVRYLTKSNIAGLLGGIIFGFCPNQLMHSGQHLGFTINWWIPLYILCLFRLKNCLCIKNIFLCVLSGVCLVLTNYYYGYFLLIFTIIFLFYWLAEIRKGFRYFFWAGFMGFIVLLPFLLRHWEGVGYSHPVGDLFKYSSHWYDYFLPSEFHPLFGKWAGKVSRHYFERSLYLGYFPLLLGILAIVKKGDRIKYFFVVSAILFFIFSLPPMFNIYGIKIPNFPLFAYKIFPMFRVYARMGILVIMSVGILAGYGLRHILKWIKNRWVRGCVVGICFGIVLFEYINFPPFHNIDLSGTPEVYKWLANETEDMVIVEYPFVRSIEARHSEYLFYQRIHKKRLVNGAQEGTIGDAFRRQMQYPQVIETAKMASYLGADYVVLHKGFYSKKEIGKIKENPGLEFVKDFPDAIVYRVIAKAGELVTVFWENFASWEKWDDGNYWRWMGNNATIWVGNGPIEKSKIILIKSGQKSKIINLKFKILAFAMERELEIYVNDVIVKKLNINVVSSPGLAQEVVLKDVLLRPGENIIRFYTPQGEDRIGDVLGNGDNRRVSFGISRVTLTDNSV